MLIRRLCLGTALVLPALLWAQTPPTDVPHADGARLYSTYCALCHGAERQGYAADNAPSLTSSTFLATASDDFLRAAIERGRPGTAMAGYAQSVGGPLTPKDVHELVGFLRAGAPPVVLPAKPANGTTSAGLAQYTANCVTCHGTADKRASAVHLANPMFLDSASDAYLREAITRGRPGTRMEAWGGKLTPKQIDDVIVYIRSLARPMPPAPTPPWGTSPQPTGPLGLPLADAPVGPIVVNPKGKAPAFTLKDDLYVTVEQVAKAVNDKRRIIIADARPPSDFLRLHIKGAVSVPYYDQKAMDRLPNDGTWVVAYCACPHHVSGTLIAELRKRGFQHTAVLDEGIFVWQHDGHPVVMADDQLPIPAPPPTPTGGPLPPAATIQGPHK